MGKLAIKSIQQFVDKQFLVYDGIQYILVDVLLKVAQQLPISSDIEQVCVSYKQNDKLLCLAQIDSKGQITTYQNQKQFTLFKKQGDFIYQLPENAKWKYTFNEYIITISRDYELQIYNLITKRFQTFIFESNKQEIQRNVIKMKPQNNIKFKILDNLLIVQGDSQTLVLTLGSYFQNKQYKSNIYKIVDKIIENKQIAPDCSYIIRNIQENIQDITFMNQYMILAQNNILNIISLKNNKIIKQIEYFSQIQSVDVYIGITIDSDITVLNKNKKYEISQHLIVNIKDYPLIMRPFTEFENYICKIQTFINDYSQLESDYDAESESNAIQMVISEFLNFILQNIEKNNKIIIRLLTNLLICLINRCHYKQSLDVFQVISKYDDNMDYQQFIKYYITMNASQYLISYIPSPQQGGIDPDLYQQILVQVTQQDHKTLYEMLKLWGCNWFNIRDLIMQLENMMRKMEVDQVNTETLSLAKDPFKYIRQCLIFLYEQNKQYEKSYWLRKDINDQHYLVDYCLEHDLYDILYKDIDELSTNNQQFNNIAQLILQHYNWQINKVKQLIIKAAQLSQDHSKTILSKLIQITNKRNLQKLIAFCLYLLDNSQITRNQDVLLYFIEGRIQIIISMYELNYQNKECYDALTKFIILSLQCFQQLNQQICIVDCYILQQMIIELQQMDLQYISTNKEEVNNIQQLIFSFDPNQQQSTDLFNIILIKNNLLEKIIENIGDSNKQLKQMLQFYSQLYQIIEQKQKQNEIKNKLIQQCIQNQQINRLADTLNFLEQYKIQVSNKYLQTIICEVFDGQNNNQQINIIDLLDQKIAQRIPNNLLIKTQYGIQLVNKLFLEEQMLQECMQEMQKSQTDEQYKYIQARKQGCITNLQCQICQQIIDPETSIYVTFMCGHSYHEKCLLHKTNKYGDYVYVCPKCLNEKELFQLGVDAYIDKMI